VIHHANHFAYFNGIAVDPDGNVFVSGGRNGMVVELLAATGELAELSISPQLNEPLCVSFDAEGNLYVLDGSRDTNGKRVVKLPAG
jgi:sugar lactone lactonase YvrE